MSENQSVTADDGVIEAAARAICKEYNVDPDGTAALVTYLYDADGRAHRVSEPTSTRRSRNFYLSD